MRNALDSLFLEASKIDKPTKLSKSIYIRMCHNTFEEILPLKRPKLRFVRFVHE